VGVPWTIRLNFGSDLCPSFSYTKNGVIPPWLQINSMDSQGVKLLSSPKAIVCRLQRTITYSHHPERSSEISWRTSVCRSPLAVWWAPGALDDKSTVNRKYLWLGKIRCHAVIHDGAFPNWGRSESDWFSSSTFFLLFCQCNPYNSRVLCLRKLIVYIRVFVFVAGIRWLPLNYVSLFLRISPLTSFDCSTR
jgi:hypothetical protein